MLLPYPVFQGGKKIAIQRGGGMCQTFFRQRICRRVVLKWFITQQNCFVYATGYLPVTKAFDNHMKREIYGKNPESPNY